jgi:hypothetical protein
MIGLCFPHPLRKSFFGWLSPAASFSQAIHTNLVWLGITLHAVCRQPAAGKAQPITRRSFGLAKTGAALCQIIVNLGRVDLLFVTHGNGLRRFVGWRRDFLDTLTGFAEEIGEDCAR